MTSSIQQTLRRAVGSGILLATAIFCGQEAKAANQTWGANNSTAWYTVGNWAGGAYPGLQGAASANNDIATWTAAATNTQFGINMGTASLNLGAVAIDVTRGNTNTSIGDSSATAGSLRLYGATVNSVADVVLRNNSIGLLTLQAAQSGTMSLAFNDTTDNKIYIDNSGGITISSIISGNKLSLAGSGSGVLTLSASAANTYSGNTTISSGVLSVGSDTATLGDGTGTLVLAGGTFFRAGQTTAQTFANPISMTADSFIGGNPTTGSRTIPFSSSTVSGTAGILGITNTATSGSGLLQVRFSGAFTFARPVTVGKAFSGSGVMLQFYNSATTGSQTWSGLISGGGTLYKNVSSGGGGDTILSSGNSYSGGTEIRAGFFGLGTDNALGTGNVTLGFDSNPLGLFASGAARALTNDIIADPGILNSTNLQIKGSQNFTHSGRIVITNFMQFIISNTALTTFSGIVTNIGVGVGITKSGPGTLVLSGTNTFTGSATVAAGRLALSGNGNITGATNISILGGATLDLSTLNSTLVLSNTQTFRSASTNGTGGTLGGSLTLGTTSPLIFGYSNGVPSLTVTGGVFTVSSGNAATVAVGNGGVGLAAADYKLVAAGTGGSVTGTGTTSVSVTGDGLVAAGAFLVISNAEIYLRVTNAPTPPNTPVANAATSTNVIFFTASWNTASGAGGYHLDVATDAGFTSLVSGYNDADAGSVTSFVVTNLNPLTVYYYRVRGTNIYGASGNSATIPVQTLVAPYVWNAGGGNWSATTSWQFANPPTNGVLVGFTGAGGSSANDLSALGLTSLVFSNGAGAYTISGNPLALTNGILNSSISIETISAPLTLGAAQTFNASIGSLNISGPVTNAGFTLTVNATAASTNSGSISGAGALVKTGAATLLLSGANTYTGATTNSAGNLQVAGGSALPDAATLSLANTAGVTLTVDANETVGSISGGDSTTIALGANNLTAGGDGTATTLTSAITGAGKLVKTGAGTLTLNKTTAYGSSFILRTEGGTLDLNRSGSSLLGILGSGNRIELAGGTLQISGSAQANFGFASGGLDIYSDSTIFFNRTTSSSSQSPTNSSPLNFKSNATLSFGYANVSGGTTLFDGAANTLQGNATLALGAYAITIASPIGESGGSYSLTKTGAGQLNLNSINTYSGPTTNSQGTIQVNATSTFGNGSGTLVLAGGDILAANSRIDAPIANPVLMTTNTTIYGNSTLATGLFRYFPFSNNSITTLGGTLTLRNAGTAGTNEFRLQFTGGGFNFTQPIVIGSASDSNSLTTSLQFYSNTNVAVQTFSGNISGLGSINRSVAIAGSGGVTILSGSNTYVGTTTISEGTLLVKNTTGSGTGTNTVFVTSGGTLGGTGIIASLVTNSFGSTLFPGLGGLDTSTLTISNALGLAGNASFTLNRTNAQNSARVSGLASVRYGGTLTLTNVGDALLAGDTFTLFGSAVYSGGFTNLVLPALTAGLVWNTNNLSVNGSVSVQKSATALALASSSNPSGYLASLIFTANVTPTNATGTVTFFAGATPFSTNSLTAGSTTSGSISSLLRGTNAITAIYSGDANYFTSTNSLNQVVTNHPPIAGTASYTAVANLPFKIFISQLLTNVTDADGDTVSLSGVSVTTNGLTLMTNGVFIGFTTTNAVNDQFTYSVTDTNGGSASGLVNLTVIASAFTGQPATITVSGSTANVKFGGIPGFNYSVQRSTNLVSWTVILTTNAPGAGVFDWTDGFNDLGVIPSSAYYQLQWNP